ncbi:transporter [Leptolyngbya sp. 'hensonii']|uniref:AEC family transporter n=1 Tax=Leptolyngbya sp. 'hensonii' TaxID=1922337 RepID=UPI00094F5366|nr:AEC family transporter [Leptolyngbya sp. 'hensonii']OLP17973.1 transporter [Leptolyngbya sp. 'hensonii']
MNLENPLINLYASLIGWAVLGYVLGRLLPRSSPKYVGKALYWVGIPISIVAFMRRTNLTGYILIAPVAAWVAIIVGACLAWIWIELGVNDERLKALALGIKSNGEQDSDQRGMETAWGRGTQGSFLMAMMVGNTAYMGFPVVLSLVGPEYFVWAVLYNTFGTTLGLHGLGFTVAAHFGKRKEGEQRQQSQNLVMVLLKNPALWSFVIGIAVQNIPLPGLVEQSLQTGAKTIVNLSLVLIGMQLSHLASLSKLNQAFTCLAIKMVAVPLIVGTGLMFFGVTGDPRLVIVLMMAMPPSFATILYAEAYNLDQELAVTAVVFGSISLLFTLPLWMFLFGPQV